MTEIEQQLRAAMHRAVDAREAMPGSLIIAVRERHRRRTRLLACLAVLIVAAVTIPAVIVARAVVASPAPATHPAPARRAPMTLTGLPLPPGTDLQLLVPDPNGWAEWYSTATGTTTPIAGFPSAPPPDGSGGVVFGRVQGGFVVSAFRLKWFCAYDCAGPAWNYYFVADGARVATKIGAGLVSQGTFQGVVASSHAGAVWLSSYPRSSDNVATTSAIAQLVSTTGQALGPRYRLPAGYLPKAGVGRYLLLGFMSGKRPSGPPVYLLWDPATHQAVRRIVDAFAAGPDQIAWTPGCRGCRLQILNVATGKNLGTSIPAGLQTVWGYNASFSDNGPLLEFRPITVGSSFTTPEGAVDIISTISGRPLAVIPALSTSRWFVVHWLAGGPTLLVADGRASGARPPNPPTQIGFWQPGDSRLRVASVPASLGGWLVSSAG